MLKQSSRNSMKFILYNKLKIGGNKQFYISIYIYTFSTLGLSKCPNFFSSLTFE